MVPHTGRGHQELHIVTKQTAPGRRKSAKPHLPARSKRHRVGHRPAWRRWAHLARPDLQLASVKSWSASSPRCSVSWRTWYCCRGCQRSSMLSWNPWRGTDQQLCLLGNQSPALDFDLDCLAEVLNRRSRRHSTHFQTCFVSIRPPRRPAPFAAYLSRELRHPTHPKPLHEFILPF